MTLSAPTARVKGLALAVLGVLVLTPDTLLMRLVGADSWGVLFWRGLFMAAGYFALMLLWYRTELPAKVLATGSTGILVASLFATTTILFVVAINETTVANTLVIIAAAPLFAAILGWAALGERPAWRTWIAILVAIGGIALIVADGLSGGTWVGDLIALATAVALGGHFVLVRSARDIDLTPAIGISGLITAAVALVAAESVALSPPQIGWMALLALVILPISFVLITAAPRYIPAAEVGLVVLLETVLGPLWVWLAIGEEPGRYALIGGAVVIGALVLNFSLARWADRPRRFGTAG
jgi:drug/metabolite transporter (DMT)-like permease